MTDVFSEAVSPEPDANRVPSEHLVQLFDTPESLATTVAHFLARGIARREPLLVVARPRHLSAFASALAADGVSLSELVAAGQLTVIDARELLRQITRYGMPDQDRFEMHVGSLVRRLTAEAGSLRVYGEMVDLLAEQGNLSAARQLEELWNALLATVPASLLCGYASAHFVVPADGAPLRAICGCHSDVLVNPEDLLAAWLLDGQVVQPRPAS